LAVNDKTSPDLRFFGDALNSGPADLACRGFLYL
jgi:hypothetical protein